MAWQMKNSAGMQIERRPEPYLTEEMKQGFEADLLPRYPTRRAATLPILHAIGDKYGWVPYQAIEEIAAFLGLQASEVGDTASFYEMFHLAPKGKYLIQVCQSISCELTGHEGIMHAIEKKLNVGVGATTGDKKFTLIHVECLGSCGTGPCCLINDKLHENLTPEKMTKLLDDLA